MPAFLRSNRLLPALLIAATLVLAGCSSAEDRAKAAFDRGAQFAEQGDPIKASLEFRNAIQLKPNYPEATFGLAMAQEQQGNYAEAASGFMATLEQDPNHVPARVRLGYVLLAAGQTDEATKYVDQAAALAANDPSVIVAQAAVAMKKGETDKGVELANAALAINPELSDALMVLASERMLKADPAGAIAMLDRAPAASDGDVGFQLLRLSALDALDDQPAVVALFDKLIALTPETDTFRQALVTWYLGKNRLDDAEQVIRQHAVDNPQDDEARLALVSFLRQNRGADAAIADLETAAAERAAANGDTFTLRSALSQLYVEAGKNAEALALLQAIVADTTDADKRNEARVQLARMLSSTGDNAGALAVTDTILGEDASNVDALSVRASLRLLDGDNAPAIEDLLQALNEAPDNGGLHGLLAEAYERDGSLVLAEEQYAKALDLNQYAPATGLPVARFLLRNGKTDQAIRTLEQVRTRAPQDREVLALLAQLKLGAQDYVGAQEIAEALRQIPDGTQNAVADRISAAALIGLNRADDGISLLQAAVEGDAGAAVLPELISAYMQSGKADLARDYLLGLLEDQTDNGQALVLLGSVYASNGEADLAEETLKRASDLPGADGDVALAQYYVSLGNTEAAEAVIATGLEQDANNQVLQLLSASIYERTGRFDQAIEVYEKLYAQDQNVSAVANDLASLLSERRGDPESLERAFQIAQRLRGSEIPQYVDTIGWIYYLRGDYDGALPLLRTAASRLPNVPLVQYHLGMTYSALGQTELAKTSLERALAITPPLGDADAQKARDALKLLEEGDTAEETPKS